MTTISTRFANYSNSNDITTIVALLDHYAQDPMGGSTPLAESTKANLGTVLLQTPHAFSVFADVDGITAGLANCFWGVSTFAAKPLVNIHDVIVHSNFRGKGLARALFAAIENEAKTKGACKITLEVLSGNHSAKTLYRAQGFGNYSLDAETGTAEFWQKSLM
jgi:ribosomal protein S18 acetylase RimI-like enzyme